MRIHSLGVTGLLLLFGVASFPCRASVFSKHCQALLEYSHSHPFVEFKALDETGQSLRVVPVVLGPPSTDNNIIPFKPTPIAALTESELGELVEVLQQFKPLVLQIDSEGCASRTGAINWLLEQMGVYSKKVYITANHGCSKLATRTRVKGHRRWNFHVAPLVYKKVEGTEEVQPVIIDLSLDQKPLSIPEWLAHFRVALSSMNPGSATRPAEFKFFDVTNAEEGFKGAPKDMYHFRERFDHLDTHPNHRITQWRVGDLRRYRQQLLELSKE